MGLGRALKNLTIGAGGNRLGNTRSSPRSAESSSPTNSFNATGLPSPSASSPPPLKRTPPTKVSLSELSPGNTAAAVTPLGDSRNGDAQATTPARTRPRPAPLTVPESNVNDPEDAARRTPKPPTPRNTLGFRVKRPPPLLPTNKKPGGTSKSPIGGGGGWSAPAANGVEPRAGSGFDASFTPEGSQIAITPIGRRGSATPQAWTAASARPGLSAPASASLSEHDDLYAVEPDDMDDDDDLVDADDDDDTNFPAANLDLDADDEFNVNVCTTAEQIFRADGTFKDGGFRITRNGIAEAPRGEKVHSLRDVREPTSMSLVTIKSIKELRTKSVLGAGASGKVYLCEHVPSGTQLAVKVVNVYDEELRKQLLKELATLGTHVSRFLVRSYGALYDGSGAVHVLLEYMDGGSLEAALKRGGAVPELITRQIAQHCLRALAALHRANVLHRDVKAGNVLLSRRLCRSKLADFGLAREVRSDTAGAATFVGTMAYMSPERLQGSKYTQSSDVWGLGMVVCECLLGRYPFEKPKSYFNYLDNALSGDVLCDAANVSADARSFVQLCTAVDPAKRPPAIELLKHRFITCAALDPAEFARWLDRINAVRAKR